MDHLDQGVLAHAVFVATELDRRHPETERRVPYMLDMRPLCCGLTWGLAEDGRMWMQPVVDRCDAFSPPGYRTLLTGGVVTILTAGPS